MAQRDSKVSKDCPRIATRGPRKPKIGPEWPKLSQNVPKMVPGGSTLCQSEPGIAPRRTDIIPGLPQCMQSKPKRGPKARTLCGPFSEGPPWILVYDTNVTNFSTEEQTYAWTPNGVSHGLSWLN